MADVGEGSATRYDVLLLLVVMPFSVVGRVVDVDVLGVVVVCVLVVELLEEGVWMVCVGEPDGVVVDHQVGFLEDVGDRSDRDVVLWIEVEEVRLVWGWCAGCRGSVREGRRGGISIELHRRGRATQQLACRTTTREWL